MPESKDGSFKMFLLGWFVLQSTSQTLLGAYTLSAVPKEDNYNINHFLLMAECCKFFLSCVLEAYTLHTQGQLRALMSPHKAWHWIMDTCKDGWKMAIPAILYWVANNLSYLSLANLPAPVFQVLLQSKVLITALLSVCLLQRKYVARQWICLLALAIGVASVVLGESHIDLLSFLRPSGNARLEAAAVMEATSPPDSSKSTVVGVLAISVGAFMGSMAGVFFEVVLKRKSGGAAPQPQSTIERQSSCCKDDVETADTDVGSEASEPDAASVSKADDGDASQYRADKPSEMSSEKLPSVWLRNVQLAFFSIIAAWLRVQQSNRKTIKADGIPKDFFHGFTALVWVQVVQLAIGGLVVAAVIKYSDNVMRGLATGLSVVFATAFSIAFMGTKLTSGFIMGAVFIVASVYFFSNPIPTELKLPGSIPGAPPKSKMILGAVVALLFMFEVTSGNSLQQLMAMEQRT